MTFKEKILFSVATWQGWQRYAATLILLCMLVGFWWFFSYQVIYQTLEQARVSTMLQELPVRMQQSEDDTIIDKETIALYPGIVDELHALSLAQTYEKRRAAFFVHTSLNALEDALSDACKECEFGICNSHLEKLPMQKDWYTYAQMKDTFACSLQHNDDTQKLAHFFKKFESLDNVHIERCHMTKNPDTVEIECLLGVCLPNN